MRSFCIPEFGLSAACFFGVDRHIRRGGGGWDEGRGRLRRPAEGSRQGSGERGRRKRPLPAQPYPRPYEQDSFTKPISYIFVREELLLWHKKWNCK